MQKHGAIDRQSAAIRRMAMVLLALGLWQQCTHAQFSRNARDIEIKGLDLHPRPSSLREVGTQIYGAIDLGLVTDARPSKGTCKPDSASRLAAVGPSYIGVRATEMLQGGWRATAHLEHGLNTAKGAWANDCELAFDRALTVGLQHRDWGQLDLGRVEHPAYAVALRADPWAGNGVASPGDTSYYVRPADAAGLPQQGSRFRVRAPAALTYSSPRHATLWLHVQVSLSRDAGRPAVDGLDTDEREYGGALHFQSAGLHAALAYQRWNRETRAWPISVTYEFLRWTAHVGLTTGETAAGNYRNLLIGASLRDQGGARPGEWRVGLNLHRGPGGTTEWKAGAGRVWPLSRRTHLEADAGLDGPSFEGRRLRAGIGLRHQFSM